MKYYLLLGRCDLDIQWLELDAKGGHVRHNQMIPVRIYKEMPVGYVGPAKGYTVNAKFAPLTLEVPAGQWLQICGPATLPTEGMVAILP